MDLNKLISIGKQLIDNKQGGAEWVLHIEAYLKNINTDYRKDLERLIKDCKFFPDGGSTQHDCMKKIVAILNMLSVLENEPFLNDNMHQPLMTIFHDNRLRYAEAEFKEAIADYNAGRYKQSVAWVCKSTESAMKAIYLYKTGETIQCEFGPLVAKMNEFGFIPIDKMLSGYSKTRNEAVHGTDASTYEPTNIDAMFEINRFASLILFLYQKSGMGDDLDG